MLSVCHAEQYYLLMLNTSPSRPEFNFKRFRDSVIRRARVLSSSARLEDEQVSIVVLNYC